MFRKSVVAALYFAVFVAIAQSQASSVVDYSFYLPATVNGYLYAGASTTDATGNTYIAGTFPYYSSKGNYANGFFVAKYNSSGKQVFYNSFGGTVFPQFYGNVYGVAVDSGGRMYIVGSAGGAYGGGLPVTANAYQTSGGGSFLAVVSADGSKLDYASYFSGSSGGGQLSAVAVDSAGNAYVAGTSYGTVTTTPGAPYSTPFTNNQGFVAKFNPNATTGPASLIYSTYLGAPASQVGSPGSGVDAANGIAVDGEGNAYVTGNAGQGQAYPTTPGSYRYNGRDPINDAYVTKINPTGTVFLYSALLGPGSGNAIALDSSNDVYVAGSVYEDDYPTTSGAYQTTYPSGFVTELNPSGSALVSSTFLGGPDDSYVSGSPSVTPSHIALPPGCASNCAVYVAGSTNGSDLPLIDPVQSYVPGSPNSGFFVELAGGLGSALQSSYFASGAGFDTYQAIPGISVDSTGNIYLVGDALPSQLPVTQTTAGATGEGFLAKIAPSAGTVLAVSPSSVTFPQQVVDVSTAQEGLPPQTVYLENLGSESATLSSIHLSSTLFSETNNCNGAVAAGGYCTLTLGFTPSTSSTTTAPQTGTLTVASNAIVNPSVLLAGTAINDRYIVAGCGGVSPCPGLTYADTTVGSAAAAQLVTVTNLGNVPVAPSAITASLPDYGILTNCPVGSGSLAKGQSCEISIQFHPTQVGLRAPATITITSPGTTANTINIAVSGTGLLSQNASSLVLLDKTLNFGTETVGATSGASTVTVFNNGSSPATVFTPTTSTTGDATGVSDYVITSKACGDILPQNSCTIGVSFLPTAAGTRTGLLTIPTSTSSTPLTSNLTGIGLAAKQELEFTPEAVTFPEQVIDAVSSSTSVSVYNVGPSPVSIDRVLISGSYAITSTTCPQTTLAPAPLTGPSLGCSVHVVFNPTVTGLQTGTVTVVDTEGNQSVLSLAGTAVAQNGSIFVSPAGLNFIPLPVGKTSDPQNVTFSNVGNSPVTVTSVVPPTDFLFTGLSSGGCPAAPFTLSAGASCSSWAYFSPTRVANPDTGTLNVTTTAGPRSVSLNGVGEATTKAVLLTPPGTAGMNFGSVKVGGMATVNPFSYMVNVYNIGTDPVTFSAAPAISGANAADFSISSNGCSGDYNPLAAGASCNISLQFSPSATGPRNAVLTIEDDASTGSGVQTITLTGDGTSNTPSYTILPKTLTFGHQAVTTVSGGAEAYFYNNGTSPVSIASVTFLPAGNFVRNQNYIGDCNEGAVGPGSNCAVSVSFAPTTAGPITSLMTLTDLNGNQYTTTLFGYAITPAEAVFVSPAAVNFAPQPQLSMSAAQNISLTNNGNTVESIGQATGLNVILGSSTTGAFKVISDGCSHLAFRDDPPNNGCSISVAISPTATTALGTQNGSITIPITYPVTPTKTATVNYKVELSGTVVAPANAAELSPSVLAFLDQAVNTSSGGQSIYLTNNSNLPFTVGALTSTNTAAAGPFNLASGNCSGATLNPGANCNEEVVFAPTAAASGVKGTLSFPITYTNSQKTTLTATYSGNALAAKSSILISPNAANFGSQVAGEAAGGVLFTITNNGNQPLPISGETLTSTQAGINFTRNGYGYNQCGAGTLAPGSSCPVWVQFAPQTTGTITGTLTIGDPAASGGPHTIPLTGTGLAANQAITFSQTAVSFGNQAVGSSGVPQAIYVTNQSGSPVSNVSYALGGTNVTDFTLQTNTCGSTLWYHYGTETCALLVTFAPAKTSLGARSATVTVTYTLPGSTIASSTTIKLSGTGVPPAPAVTLFPASLSYPIQNIGSNSATQFFSVTNTGSANLILGAVASTDASEFIITSNSCAGKSIAPGAFCLVGVAFDPSAAGARAGSITIADNATGSPQAETLSGTGRLVPKVSLSSSSLTFASTDLGSTSAKQVVTVSNPGTATLAISGIAVDGADPGDFPETTTCGATLAPDATCTIAVDFTPKAVGTRIDSVALTDNASNVSGATQSIALSGVGVGVPTAAASPTTLAFGSETVKVTSAAQTVTLKNSGTGALTVTSVTLAGSDPGVFAIATNSCGTSLAAGAECAITLTFTPAATGGRSGTLVFTDNSGLDSGATQSVSLTGTGVA